MPKRRFSRYKVSSLESLQVKFDRARPDERLITVSRDGCGFCGFKNDPELQPGKILTSAFKMKDLFEIQVPSKLIYIKLIHADRDLILYGTQFLEAHAWKILPLIAALDKLADAGMVEIIQPTDEH
ncbi:MAG: hypothetical protein JWQ35_1079 [Bacteriovoracaceae bacterium]|nr:hypothetical protein [Bacteriovoracaceae bacterium]